MNHIWLVNHPSLKSRASKNSFWLVLLTLWFWINRSDKLKPWPARIDRPIRRNISFSNNDSAHQRRLYDQWSNVNLLLNHEHFVRNTEHPRWNFRGHGIVEEIVVILSVLESLALFEWTKSAQKNLDSRSDTQGLKLCSVGMIRKWLIVNDWVNFLSKSFETPNF